jgi:hypothetical protein
MQAGSTIPEIRISYGQLLSNTVSRELAQKFGFKLEDDSVYFDKTFEYWKAWDKKEKQILEALQEMLGVKFYLPIIDVTCLPFFIPQSMPVIMNFKETPDRFVDVLAHELCHLILTDNTSYREYEEAPKHFMADNWRKMYGDHEHKALVHIPVHAMCKYLWVDVMKEPSRYERDKTEVKDYHGSESYIKAWDYVDSNDYKKIVEDLKSLYEKLGRK